MIFVMLEKVVFEDNGDVDVPGAGDELKLELSKVIVEVDPDLTVYASSAQQAVTSEV